MLSPLLAVWYPDAGGEGHLADYIIQHRADSRGIYGIWDKDYYYWLFVYKSNHTEMKYDKEGAVMHNDDKEQIIRSSAAEHLTLVAATGDNTESMEMRYEVENIWLTQNMKAAL